MKITVESIKELREQSGAGVMECRNVLAETDGNIDKAVALLKQRSLFKAEKKKERVTRQGLVEAYIHTGGRIGALVELNCETDFVARTDEFKALAHNIAMQVAALDPKYILPEEEKKQEAASAEPACPCLLQQPYIRDPGITIQDLINQTIAKVGENIKVNRISRFEIGES